jgi:ectoine hydroxylase-related dioxygenase (phytanoyl-CoA dioxygenase family)
VDGAAVTSESLITESVIDEYDRYGAVCLRRAFAPEWVTEIDAGLDEVLGRQVTNLAPKPHDQPSGFNMHQFRWRDVHHLQSFVLHSPAAAIAGRLLRAHKVNFLEDASFVADAGVPGRTDWHQDLPCYNVTGKMLSIWMPLQPLSRKEGLRLVAGSHKWGKLYSPFAEGDNRPGYNRVPEINENEHEIISWDLELGDCVAFSGLVLHGVMPTEHSRSSRRFSTRWAGDAVFFSRGGVCSRSARETGLGDGDPLDCDWYPVLWTRRGGQRR